ncbi:DNA-directed RNA polymerases I, II, and III subuni t RPABC2 [Beauveria bassiana D1-5]|uniref:DNA-directed RNA polymerases I, II, and III subuni t RPABC2 n=2 Tax=Beauveria bassiana TaxID=176275 RepID=A0A0A2VS30_BEABA|nr:DNA-directed RNA polymerases I, II, and III subuni t RPABC2 [Beauveria bassiana D1-5]
MSDFGDDDVGGGGDDVFEEEDVTEFFEPEVAEGDEDQDQLANGEDQDNIVVSGDPSAAANASRTDKSSRDKKIPDEERNTTPYMTKYERARILGTRALQISMNAPVLVDLEGETDPLQIAIKELREKKIPLIVRRYLPDGYYEDWTCEELLQFGHRIGSTAAMTNNERHAAEGDPLLPPRGLTNPFEADATNFSSVATATAAAAAHDHDHDDNADNRTTAQRLRIAIPCLLCFFCLVVGEALLTTPVLQIRENLICRATFPDLLPSGADLSRHPLCKSNRVQVELALVNGWELTFMLLPSILTGVSWGIAADRYGRTRILQLANLGVLLSLFWQLTVYSFPDVLPLRLVWLQGAFFLLGGGASTYMALLYTIASDISSEAYRATAILYLGTAFHTATLLGGPVTYFAMRRGARFAFGLGIGFYVLVLALTSVIPETRSDAAVRHARADALRDDADATKHAWWDIRPLVWDLVRQTRMVTRIIFLKNATLGILLFSTIFSSLGKAGDNLKQQYAAKRFGWTMAETSFLDSIKGTVSIILTAAILPAISQVLLAKFRLPPIIKDWWMAIGSLCMAVIGSACLTAAGSSGVFIASLVVQQLGGGYEFAFRSMTSEMVDSSHIAMLFTAHSVFQLASEAGAGPVLATVFRMGLDVGASESAKA